MYKHLLSSCLILVLSGCSLTEPSTQLTQTYVCKNSKILTVTYFNNDKNPSRAILLQNGKKTNMTQGISGSGVRYTSDETGQNLVWHTKGNWGILYRDHDTKIDVLLDDCIAQDDRQEINPDK